MFRTWMVGLLGAAALLLGACKPEPIVGAGVRITQAPPALSRDRTASFTVECDRAGCTIECHLDAAPFATCASPIQYSGIADGAHSFEARAAGATDAPARHAWTVDATAPTVSFTTPPPSITGATATFSFDSSEAGCTFTCALDGTAATACSSPATFSSLAEGPHTFSAYATDAAGNTSAPATHDWTVNTALPTATITSSPASPTNQTTATFELGCDQSGCTFECSLDSAAFASCTSPQAYSGLSDGSHTFAVRATHAGLTGPDATHAWTIDTQPPTVTIASSPADPTSSSSASFEFGCSEAGCTYLCSLDGAPAICTSPATYASLAEGPHTFSVTATDAAGNPSATPATRAWVIDQTRPTVSFTTTPPSTTGASATFSFASSESGCTFTCALDGAPATPCSSPATFSSLADGPHTISVLATDLAGNTSTSAATHAWTVNTSSPVVTITSSPASPTNQTTASFQFTCDQAGCTFECSLDSGAFASCSSPQAYSSLADGGHTFAVHATSSTGFLGGDTTRAWTVDTQAPTVTLTSSPANPTSSSSASFSFDCSETGCAFSCSLDGAPATSCTSPATYSSLAATSHTFSVTATDAAGNPSAAPATRTWVIDQTAPTVTFSSTPPDPTRFSSATFFFAANETGCSFTCALDGGGATSCTSPATRSGLADGLHSFTVTATDPAGNAGTSSYSWTVDTVIPVVTVSAAPPAVTSSTEATFTFSCNETPCTLSCTFDGAPLPCSSPQTLSSLSDGSHTFNVRGQDAAGNWSSTVSRTWAVDTTPPQTTITSGPASGPATDATFSFSANETATFECSLDGAAFSACTSPASYTVALGEHTFEVRATDVVGHVDATPASWTWVAASTYISSLSPSRGTVNIPMIIKGAGFGATQGASVVTIGGLTATVRFWSDTYVVVTVPTGLAAGTPDVAISPFPTARARYTVIPWIASATPSELAVGDTLTLTGASFGSAQGTATMGGTSAAVQSWTDTSVQLTVPAAIKGRVAVALQTAAAQSSNVVYATVRGSDVWLVRGEVPEARDGSSSVWTGTELIVWGGNPSGNPYTGLNTGGRYDPVSNTWRRTSTVGAPTGRSGHTAVWTGTEMIVFGGYTYNGTAYTEYNTGGRYDPVTDTWSPLATANAPSVRQGHTAVWTGSRMIVWGGMVASTYTWLNTGAAYDPVTDTWSPISLTGAPIGRSSHTASWTGTEMIVWGGLGPYSARYNTGARYNPSTDTWTAMTTTGAPTGRQAHTATWTGSQLVVFGGYNTSVLNTGGRYSPATDTWTGISTGPSARMRHTAVWTGSRVVVYGGDLNSGVGLLDGSRYDPVANTWSATSTVNATARTGHRAVWTGIEMLAYGGSSPMVGRYDPVGDAWTNSPNPTWWQGTSVAVWTGTEMISWGGANSNRGVRYDPATDTFVMMSTTGAPQGRTQPIGVWTGTEFFVTGGNYSGMYLNTGGRYNPVTDTWTATSTVGAPPGRTTDGVWSGTEVLFWGGVMGAGTYTNTGGRYNPATDSWTTMSTTGAPTARYSHCTVWAGTKLFVWGGYTTAGNVGDGALYDPATDTWTPISATGAPSARSGALAVWTGTDVVLFGGGGASGILGDGARYNPTTNTWTALSLAGSPGGRENPSAVWSGTEMIVWAGRNASYTPLNTGSRYNPATNAWTAMTTVGAPAGRYQHSAVWTGSAMLVFGGYYGGYGTALYLP